MRIAVFVIALLAASLVLALPALAAAPPYAKVDHYRFVISGYSDTLIFETEMQAIDGYVDSSISDNNADPKMIHQALFIQMPHTTPMDLVQAMDERLLGQKPHAFRSASVHGVKFYWYCPQAQWVHIRLYITPAYETTERYLATINVDP